MKKRDPRIDLPSINEVMAHLSFPDLDTRILTQIVRQVVARYRAGKSVRSRTNNMPDILDAVRAEVMALTKERLRNVINGTGIIFHTGLGRAFVDNESAALMQSMACGFCNLELDLETGDRGNRTGRIERLAEILTGGEACAVVNNNAAAVFLVLNTLAAGREVIVSRGELVEIGGSFRLPEIMERSGAILKEIGTTNKTSLVDYERAIKTGTAMILKVHPSNYRVEGFTSSVSLAELAALCKKKRIPLVHDLGGGVLVDLKTFGLPTEPIVGDSLKGGADLVTFSGDKILGGPQAGVIVGRRSLIDKLKGNPLHRVLRCDKITVSLLESTLRLYLNLETLSIRHPMLKMMTKSVEGCRTQAVRLVDGVTDIEGFQARIVESVSETGSGTLPGEKIPSVAVEIDVQGISVDTLAERMRLGEPPVIGYIRRGKYRLDLRTVLDGQEDLIAGSLRKIVAKPQ